MYKIIRKTKHILSLNFKGGFILALWLLALASTDRCEANPGYSIDLSLSMYHRSLHWDAAQISIFPSGRFMYSAERVANFRRQTGFFDIGWYYSYGVDIKFYTGFHNGKCTGSLLYAKALTLGGLHYKRQVFNDTKEGRLPIADYFSRIKCVSSSSWFR